MENRLKVYFDGRCGLCAREIKHYQKIAPAGHFQWLDIVEAQAELRQLGLNEAQALKQLYSIDTAGTLYSGVDTFIQIWSRLPRWQWLAKFMSLPGIYSIAKLAYQGFANWRFNRLTHCKIAANHKNID